jgi:hypothetical protein
MFHTIGILQCNVYHLQKYLPMYHRCPKHYNPILLYGQYRKYDIKMQFVSSSSVQYLSLWLKHAIDLVNKGQQHCAQFGKNKDSFYCTLLGLING